MCVWLHIHTTNRLVNIIMSEARLWYWFTKVETWVCRVYICVCLHTHTTDRLVHIITSDLMPTYRFARAETWVHSCGGSILLTKGRDQKWSACNISPSNFNNGAFNTPSTTTSWAYISISSFHENVNSKAGLDTFYFSFKISVLSCNWTKSDFVINFQNIYNYHYTFFIYKGWLVPLNCAIY